MAIDVRKLNPNQLNDLINRAQQRQTELQRDRANRMRDKLAAMAKAEGFTLDELFGSSKGKGKGKTGQKVKPKYRNPANGAETWSGRGKRPRWFNAAIAAGKKEKDLLIG